MSPTIRRTLIVLAVAIVLIAVFWWLGRPKPIAITAKEIDQGKVELTIANTRAGTIEACQRAKLSTILGGRIEALPIKEGDRVKKGQLLMKLWNDDQQAQSALALTQVATARQRVTEICAQATNAEREANRQTSLRERGFVSTSREDSARTDAQARHAACEAVKADVTQFQAKVNATRVEQGRTILYAPFDGTVAKIVGEVGEYSTPSPPGIQMPPAVDLIDDSCLYVKAPMDEVDAPKIKAGQPVRISLDALPKQSFPGKVRRVAPFVSAVEKQARTVDIEADFNTPGEAGKLLVGYSADIEVILAVRDNVVRVPTSALLEGSRVLVAGSNGQLEERKIKTGLANWEFTEVLEGLNAGERVVTSLERAGVKAGAHYTLDDKPQVK
jgi:HlyD family secretion protein